MIFATKPSDVDAKPFLAGRNAFLVGIVLTATSMKALRDAEAAYLMILKSY